MVVMSLFERTIVHLPLSIVYHLFMGIGTLSMFFEEKEGKNTVLFIIENKFVNVIMTTVFSLFVQYAGVYTTN